MILHLDREGNDCIWKLQCHWIQILHSEICSVYSLCINNGFDHTGVGFFFSMITYVGARTDTAPKDTHASP